jgi:hypothetical protein
VEQGAERTTASATLPSANRLRLVGHSALLGGDDASDAATHCHPTAAVPAGGVMIGETDRGIWFQTETTAFQSLAAPTPRTFTSGSSSLVQALIT